MLFGLYVLDGFNEVSNFIICNLEILRSFGEFLLMGSLVSGWVRWYFFRGLRKVWLIILVSFL